MNYSYPAGTHSKASLGDTHSVLPAPYSWLPAPCSLLLVLHSPPQSGLKLTPLNGAGLDSSSREFSLIAGGAFLNNAKKTENRKQN